MCHDGRGRKKLGIQGFHFSLITLEKTTLLQTRKVCTKDCTLCLLETEGLKKKKIIYKEKGMKI